MKKSKIILVVFSLLILFGCEQYSGYETSEYATENEGEPLLDSAILNSEIPLSSTAATYQDPERQFVRTADLSMEVENVYQSTTRIEKKVAESGGFITESQLYSRVLSKEVFEMDADSVREVKKYFVQNTMTVRIPQQELGNFLHSLGDEMKFLHHRNISAEDVSLNFVMAELEKNRLDKTSEKLGEINKESGKIPDKQNVVSSLDENHSEINFQKISTLKLKDEVAFSTVTLLLNEKEKIAETVVANLKNHDSHYRPGFWYSAGKSVEKGFYFFQSVCLVLLYVWPIWLILLIVFFGIKFYRKKAGLS